MRPRGLVRSRCRLGVGLISALGALIAPVIVGGPVGATAPPHWVATWTASPTAAGSVPGHSCPSVAGLKNQTVRNIIYSSISGTAVRVRVTNVFGTTPLVVGRVAIAVAATGAATSGSGPQVASFAGQPGVTIPAGAEVVSDPVSMAVGAGQRLTVSVFVPNTTGPATQHYIANQTDYVSKPGNWVFTRSAEPFDTPITCSLFVDGVDVSAGSSVKGAVVAIGDSITDGVGSTSGADDRWPNYLSRRIGSAGGTLSVTDAGIAGNEILTDRQPALYGPGALNRLDRDVLSQSGVKDVILLEGINDIGIAKATADQLIAADKTIIARVHAQGLKIFGATLTPQTGSHPTFGYSFGTATAEATRQALNQWIRTGGAFDGVVDFDRAVADPIHPSHLAPSFDSGDHLHPNDAGYRAMAAAVDLSMF